MLDEVILNFLDLQIVRSGCSFRTVEEPLEKLRCLNEPIKMIMELIEIVVEVLAMPTMDKSPL